MTEVSLSWVDDGKPFELRPIPINGQRELQELALRYGRAEAARQNTATLSLHAYILMAKRLLDAKGPEQAKAAWDATLQSHDLWRKEFDWPVDEFEEGLAAFYDKYTLRALAAKDADEAEAKLKEQMAAANAEFEAHREDILNFNADFTLIELYWRLRAARISAIGDSDGKVPLDWPKRSDSVAERAEKRDIIIETLGEYATQDDLAAIRHAMNGDKNAPLDMEDLKIVDEEAMRGKSETPSGNSTESKPVSPPSSEPDGGAATRSAKNAT